MIFRFFTIYIRFDMGAVSNNTLMFTITVVISDVRLMKRRTHVYKNANDF